MEYLSERKIVVYGTNDTEKCFMPNVIFCKEFYAMLSHISRKFGRFYSSAIIRLQAGQLGNLGLILISAREIYLSTICTPAVGLTQLPIE